MLGGPELSGNQPFITTNHFLERGEAVATHFVDMKLQGRGRVGDSSSKYEGIFISDELLLIV